MAAKSIVSEVSGVVTQIIKVDGKDLPLYYGIRTIHVLKEINKISSARIEFIDGSISSVDSFEISNKGNLIPGKEIEIQLGYQSKNKTVFKGIIVKHGLKVNKRGESILTVECKHPAVKMTMGRKNAVYTEKKDADIIKEVAQKHSVTAKVGTTADAFGDVVQHYTTDWDFIMMRAEIHGLVTICKDDGSIELAEPDPTAAAKIKVMPNDTLLAFQAEMDARTQYPKVSCASWDLQDQKVLSKSISSAKEVKAGMTDSKKLSSALGLEDYLIQTAGVLPMPYLQNYSTSKLQRSKLARIRGKITMYGYSDIHPGETIELEGMSEQFNGVCYIGGIEHTLTGGDWKMDVHLGLSQGSYAEETNQIDSPPASGMFSGMPGLATGLVKKIDQDPDGHFRVQVTIPTLVQDNMPVWARMGHFYATKESGLFFMPEIGDEVILGFINEDPMNPVILGSLYSKSKNPPLVPEEGNNIKALVTRSQCKISFDEEKKIIQIETPGGNIMTMDDDQKFIKLVDSNKNEVLMSDSGISLTTEKDVVISAKGNITMEAKGNIESKATGDLTAEGMNVQLKGSAKFAAEGPQAEVKGSAQTVIKGGMVMIN
ncbi:type VI secretion system tip protein VgrG [Roseivirga sp. BDSF3-8]|uniref:type VI secretion system tip protein VgrG n=1 Tax=Roseivirga sp. BDSF3-8 TaxID=3241598 RepID=UPI003531CC1D